MLRPAVRLVQKASAKRPAEHLGVQPKDVRRKSVTKSNPTHEVHTTFTRAP